MWNFFETGEGLWYRWNLNGAAAYLRRDGEEWRTLVRAVPWGDMAGEAGGPEPVDAAPPGVPVLSLGKGRRAALRPFLSDTPYLARMEPARLFPGAEFQVRLFLPPVLGFDLGRSAPAARVPPFTLSRTWEGDTVSGVLCHSVPPPPERAGDHPAALIRCTLLFRNGSPAPVELGPPVIYPGTLGLYEQENRLFADTVTVDVLAGGELRVGARRLDGSRYKRLSREHQTGVRNMLARRGAKLIKEIVPKL